MVGPIAVDPGASPGDQRAVCSYPPPALCRDVRLCIALALLTANWMFLAICGLTIAGLVWRVPKEEQMMIEAFGGEYKAYMQRTGRYFPKF